MRIIYVICPYGLVTGGPDALHQAVYYLNSIGLNAKIVYCDINSHKYVIPDPYKLYVKDYVLLKEIEDNKNNSVVVPETQSHLINQFKKLDKYVWWLSVDNDLNSSGIKNKFLIILKKLRLKNFRKLYKINTLKNVLKHSKFDFKKNIDVKHLCASYYAFDYVKKNIKKKKNAYLCIEPISMIFLKKSKFTNDNKKDIVLYNPKKNFRFTKKIIESAPDINFLELKGYSQDELLDIYKKAKVYIDFGNFPGAERIPKEAVINGACILTGKYGASSFYEDVPIPSQYKISADEKNIEKIVNKIKDLLNNYNDRVYDFEEYRKTVLNLERNFKEQLKKVFYK